MGLKSGVILFDLIMAEGLVHQKRKGGGAILLDFTETTIDLLGGGVAAVYIFWSGFFVRGGGRM